MDSMNLKIFKAQSGMLSAKLVKQDGATIHLHSLVKPEEEWKYFDGLQVWGDRLVLLGTGLGYHLPGIVKKIPHGCRVMLIDYYEELLKNCKKEFFSEIQTVEISSVTPDKEHLISSFLQGGCCLQFIRHPASVFARREFYNQLTSLFFPEGEGSKSGSALVLHGKFFLQEELCRALSSIGMRAVPFEYGKAGSALSYESRLQCLIQSEKPDVIISVNMLGFDGNGMLPELATRSGIPIVVWFVDDPHPILLHQRQFINKNMAAFCWERAYLPFLKSSGFGSVKYLPLAADPEMFPFTEGKSSLCRLGFVGSSMGRKFLSGIAGKFLYKDDMEPFVYTCAQQILRFPAQIDSIMESVCRETGYVLPFTDERNSVWLRSYIIHTASMIRRKQIVDTLIPEGLQTFGDPEGWRELCDRNLVTNPDIDYRTGLADIYRRIDVNVNITSCQMPSGVNQRVFDIPLCGGFVISDPQEDLGELFANDEVVTYSSVEHLKELVTCYAANEKERLEISERAMKRIKGEHTYSHRVKKILSELGC